MSDSKKEVVVRCPRCHGTDIREKQVAYAELAVWEWELNDDGDVQPVDYDTDVSPDWECSEAHNQYVCRSPRDSINSPDCGWEGNLSDLVVEP